MNSQDNADAQDVLRREHPSSLFQKQKRLVLNLLAFELPSQEIVKGVIKWMNLKSKIDDVGCFLDYGPQDLQALSLDDLIDLYQAALVFDILPVSSLYPVRAAMLYRVTDSKPDVEMLHKIYYYLPVRDPVTSRIINSIQDHREKGAYTDDEIAVIDAYIFGRGREELAEKLKSVLNSRSRDRTYHRPMPKWMQRQSRTGQATDVMEQRRPAETTQNPGTNRRRDRRGQKLRGAAAEFSMK